MADIYVNLELTGGTGTIGDPFGPDEFMSHVTSTSDRISTLVYKIKGFHEFSPLGEININKGNTVSFENWDATPPRLKLVSSVWKEGLCITHNFKNLVMETDLQSIYIGTASKTINIENCCIIGSTYANLLTFHQTSTVVIKGCTFKNYNDVPGSGRAICLDNSGSGGSFVVDSCYFEGNWKNIFYGYSATCSYRYCAFYNLPGLIAISDPGQPFQEGIGNLLNTGSPSQITGIGHIDLMNYDTALRPISLSTIINAGNPSLGLSVDLFNIIRSYDPNPDIGAAEFPLPLSYFSDSSSIDGTAVTSYIERSTLVTSIQSDSTDTYFDSTNEINRVMVFYRDSGHRQNIRIVHEGPGMSGDARWSPGARDGTWEKYRVIAFDSNGARHDLNRASIGSSEDITHSDGTMTLNT